MQNEFDGFQNVGQRLTASMNYLVQSIVSMGRRTIIYDVQHSEGVLTELWETSIHMEESK